MSSVPGYVAHRLWWHMPLTIGLTSWWSDEKAAYRFAHMPVHLEFWAYAERKNATHGGWLAVYRLESGGPLWGNGVKAMMDRFGDFVGPSDDRPPQPTPADRRRSGR